MHQQLPHDAAVVLWAAEGQLLVDFLDGIVGCGARRDRGLGLVRAARLPTPLPDSPPRPLVSLLLCQMLGAGLARPPRSPLWPQPTPGLW